MLSTHNKILLYSVSIGSESNGCLIIKLIFSSFYEHDTCNRCFKNVLKKRKKKGKKTRKRSLDCFCDRTTKTKRKDLLNECDKSRSGKLKNANGKSIGLKRRKRLLRSSFLFISFFFLRNVNFFLFFFFTKKKNYLYFF